jgi:hypothetical protein
MDFEKLAQSLRDLLKSIGVKKEEITSIVAGASVTPAKQKSILTQLDDAMSSLREIMAKTEITEQERKRRIAELRAEIERIELLRAFESDFEERMRLNRQLSRLSATAGTWETIDVFHFDTLLDSEGQDFKTLLEEADRDIKARQNLQRVLKGIEVALRVGAFGAALAAKLAAAAA